MKFDTKFDAPGKAPWNLRHWISTARAMTSRICSSPMVASSLAAALKNPTLTIVALAIRQAEYLADQLNKKEM
jgi:hypothetical protein